MQHEVVLTILVKPIDETEDKMPRSEAIAAAIHGITEELRRYIPAGEKPVAFTITAIN